MNAQQIISDLQVKGARFELREDDLLIKAPRGVLTDEVYEELRALKPEILSLLTRKDTGIEARYFKGLDCPRCQKPVEVITHPLDEEVWLHCVDPECLFKHLHHDSCQWCSDCPDKFNLIAGRCAECLKRVLLAPNQPCPECGGVRFWRHQATAEKPAGFAWHCATCKEPVTRHITFYEVNP